MRIAPSLTCAIAFATAWAQVRPRKLVLYHQLPMGETSGEVLQEVRGQFDGETIYGNDLEVVR